MFSVQMSPAVELRGLAADTRTYRHAKEIEWHIVLGNYVEKLNHSIVADGKYTCSEVDNAFR